jgi:hypothetical protein
MGVQGLPPRVAHHQREYALPGFDPCPNPIEDHADCACGGLKRLPSPPAGRDALVYKGLKPIPPGDPRGTHESWTDGMSHAGAIQ